jgi:alkylated DNA repair dioxygenase AlkB
MAQTMYKPNFLPKERYHELSRWLSQLELFPGKNKKGNNIDRMQKWFHLQEEYFNPYWKQEFNRWKGHSFPPVLFNILSQVNAELGTDMDSCLVNYYRDGNAFIPKHIDSRVSFGDHPTIVNISVGASRTLRVAETDYALENNSMFVMSGPTTEHQLLRDESCTEPRWSLTFRKKII